MDNSSVQPNISLDHPRTLPLYTSASAASPKVRKSPEVLAMFRQRVHTGPRLLSAGRRALGVLGAQTRAAAFSERPREETNMGRGGRTLQYAERC